MALFDSINNALYNAALNAVSSGFGSSTNANSNNGGFNYAAAGFGSNVVTNSNNVLGTFGDVVFSIATNGESVKVHTFDNFNRSSKARYASHDIHGRKQLIELVGFEAETVTLSIRFDISLGVSPIDEIALLRNKLYSGFFETLIIGSNVIGNFVIEDMKEVDKKISSSGVIIVAEIDLTLKEYVIDANS